ncbi:MAG: hypothetical protein HY336_01225 [Candidatus Doudnabacteria bacterium]|nr:hypothetical protein [Candidatus Doudnabacteria bacterium]
MDIQNQPPVLEQKIPWYKNHSITTPLVAFVILALSVGIAFWQQKKETNLNFPQADETANWRTYTGSTAYGEQNKFLVKYPADWSAVPNARGGEKLVYSSCEIILGVGGSGTPGPKIDSKSFQINGTDVNETTYGKQTPSGLRNFVFDWFPNDYGFELIYNPDNSKCLTDYKAILSTFKFIESDTLKDGVNSYADCLKAPGSMMKFTYPEQCVTKDGKNFVNPDQKVTPP